MTSADNMWDEKRMILGLYVLIQMLKCYICLVIYMVVIFNIEACEFVMC